MFLLSTAHQLAQLEALIRRVSASFWCKNQLGILAFSAVPVLVFQINSDHPLPVQWPLYPPIRTMPNYRNEFLDLFSRGWKGCLKSTPLGNSELMSMPKIGNLWADAIKVFWINLPRAKLRVSREGAAKVWWKFGRLRGVARVCALRQLAERWPKGRLRT